LIGFGEGLRPGTHQILIWICTMCAEIGAAAAGGGTA
jgi:hypothetical protein